jgi:histidinol-phosphate/aromatic aminotransferase/cobyric acid decarboxylase-like protein
MVLMACGTSGAAVLTPTPTFSMYGLGARMLDQQAVEVPPTAD